MHRTRPLDSTTIAFRATLATALVALGSLAARSDGFVRGDGRGEPGAGLSQPHVLEGDVADVIVRVRGASICSGTPITGTSHVITAAHCILDRDGELTTVDVVRDGVVYTPRAALVNPRYHDAPRPQLDAAVLILDRAIPGLSAALGDTVPTRDLVTLAGFQPIDTDGTLLRGTSYHDQPLPKGVTGGVVQIESVPAGCVAHASSVEIALTQLIVPCGLIPGASGGGLFTEGAEPVLLAVISTVTFDLTFNGLTPLSTVHELLNHPGEYTHALADERPLAPRAATSRS